jgi:predicted RNA-binding Zn-ribbon protein involved in translation (DUF1610 family)
MEKIYCEYCDYEETIVNEEEERTNWRCPQCGRLNE